jgi:hypothetical protein
VSLDKDGSETVSEVTNEGNDDEVEIASFTDDDDDDNDGSSHSSLPVTSSALESRRGSPGQSDKVLFNFYLISLFFDSSLFNFFTILKVMDT